MTTIRNVFLGLFAGAAFILGSSGIAVSPAEAVFNSPAPKPPKCSARKSRSSCRALRHCFWSKSRRKCKRRRQSEIDRDTQLLKQARRLIEAEQYQKALGLLRQVDNQQEPEVLNYIGLSTRKLGQVDKGIAIYHQALALDPDLVVVREYLGEGYLQKGELAKAEAQLQEIASRNCGQGCEAYDKLSEAIIAYKAGELPKAKH